MADNPAKTWSASCFNFRILMDDNTVIETTNTVGDVHRWEKTQDKKWMAEPPGMGGLLYLAGSSPPARGARAAGTVGWSCGGIIPACAGSTPELEV